MLKAVGIFLLVVVLAMLFVPQAKDFVESRFFGKQGKSEGKVIGPVSGFNPKVKEIQEVLKYAGLYAGSTDGMMGRVTRAAIKEFQKKQGLDSTGMIDKATYEALLKEKIKTRPKEPVMVKPVSAPVSAAVPGSQESGKDAASAESKAKIQDEIMGYRLKSIERTKQIQAALKKAGFYTGEIDGKMGPQTKAAISAFQKAKGLNSDGVAGSKTLEALNII